MKTYRVYYFGDSAPDEITGRLTSFDVKSHVAVFEVIGTSIPLTLTGVYNVKVLP